MIKTGVVPPPGDAEYEKEMYLAAYKLLTEAGYKAVGHDRYSRVEWHMRENCLNGWPWGGILTTGAGCFMGYLQRFSYSNIEDINHYMEVVKIWQTAHPETFRIHRRRHDAPRNEQALLALARQQEGIQGKIRQIARRRFSAAAKSG